MKPAKKPYRTCSLLLDGVPNEFRIFAAGLNPNRNGPPILFDRKAAEWVMASQAEHGVDCMIDLEHLSLDDEAPNYDPDARGWFRIELRNNAQGEPECWGHSVSWCPDGEQRLTNRTQRYLSPVYTYDAEGRPKRIVNVALCAMPSIDNMPPLVAATEKPMADGEGTTAGVNTAELAKFFGVEIDPGQDPSGFIKALLAKMDEVRAKLSGEAAPPTPDEGAAGDSAMEATEVAAAKLVCKLLDVRTLTDATLKAVEWRNIVATHNEAAAKLAREKAAIELTERTALVIRLQKCGSETPATSGLGDGALCKRLRDEPIEDLRKRTEQVEAHKAALAGQKGTADTSASAGADDTKNHGLSDRELAMCKQLKVDPAEYAAQKAAIRPKKVG